MFMHVPVFTAEALKGRNSFTIPVCREMDKSHLGESTVILDILNGQRRPCGLGGMTQDLQDLATRTSPQNLQERPQRLGKIPQSRQCDPVHLSACEPHQSDCPELC